MSAFTKLLNKYCGCDAMGYALRYDVGLVVWHKDLKYYLKGGRRALKYCPWCGKLMMRAKEDDVF